MKLYASEDIRAGDLVSYDRFHVAYVKPRHYKHPMMGKVGIWERLGRWFWRERFACIAHGDIPKGSRFIPILTHGNMTCELPVGSLITMKDGRIYKAVNPNPTWRVVKDNGDGTGFVVLGQPE